MDYNLIKHTHVVVVILFLLIYLIKTILLLANNNNSLAKFTKIVKVPEMIISTLFLATGIYMLVQKGANPLILIKIVIVLLSIPTAIIGFKKKNKILASLSLLMIITAYGLAEMNKMKANKQNIDSAVANVNDPNYDMMKHGEAIYNADCIACHGKGGTNGAGGADLTTSQMNLKAIAEQIKNGSGSMAPFKDVLTEQETNAVSAYVVTLKK